MNHPTNINSITYCSGFWIIDENVKRSKEHYYTELPKTLEMISGGNLIFYFKDDEILALVKDYCNKFSINVCPKKLHIEELPTYELSDSLLRCCKLMGLDNFTEPTQKANEKGVVHYWREYKKSGPSAYKRIITVWLSKIPLVAESAVLENPFETSDFAWIDASISRFNNKRENWDFRRSKAGNSAINHYGNNMRYYGRLLPLNASFLHGKSDTLRAVNDIYKETLRSSLGTAYAHDEETLLGLCVDAHPHLFHKIGDPSSRGMKDRVTEYLKVRLKTL